MPRDWTLVVIAVGTVVLLAVALFLLVRIALRLRTAFGERLDRLPGAPLWQRAKRGARFWSAAVIHLAIAAFLAVFVLVAARFLMQVLPALL